MTLLECLAEVEQLFPENLCLVKVEVQRHGLIKGARPETRIQWYASSIGAYRDCATLEGVVADALMLSGQAPIIDVEVGHVDKACAQLD